MRSPIVVRCAGVALAVTLAAGCASHPPSQQGTRVGSFDVDGVTVAVQYMPGKAGATGSLSVRFTPDSPGFHLYSLTMPDDGVQGLGRPIRVALSGSLSAVGSPTADQPVRTIRPAGLDVDLPVYPDGPVVVTVPVSAPTGSTRAARLLVSYAACSETVCLAPVSRHAVDFDVP